MKFRRLFETLLPFLKRKGPIAPQLVEVDREAFMRRAFRLYATKRNSAEAQEVFRILENSRAPRRAILKRVV